MDVQGMTESLVGLDLKDKTPDYKKLIDYGLDSKVADKLDDIYKVRFIHTDPAVKQWWNHPLHVSGILQTEKLTHSDLDERALDALKEFPVEGALAVLKQFLESNLVSQCPPQQ